MLSFFTCPLNLDPRLSSDTSLTSQEPSGRSMLDKKSLKSTCAQRTWVDAPHLVRRQHVDNQYHFLITMSIFRMFRGAVDPRVFVAQPNAWGTHGRRWVHEPTALSEGHPLRSPANPSLCHVLQKRPDRQGCQVRWRRVLPRLLLVSQ